ncbi:MAG: hypothetical protein BTN85_1361 [Candidatus Methanohalarchaeum thermophilum]|uniref:Uncharacterized protein n=1 Tax=Methanohalarchaeum thermophilum TaxID=1903181 RepID=A0A1Q6DWZ6_METT1|nr:MAG: hypothetical protein BTN85_1361 [Candidatus Methanohalarchaeum thermophilum]
MKDNKLERKKKVDQDKCCLEIHDSLEARIERINRRNL